MDSETAATLVTSVLGEEVDCIDYGENVFMFRTGRSVLSLEEVVQIAEVLDLSNYEDLSIEGDPSQDTPELEIRVYLGD